MRRRTKRIALIVLAQMGCVAVGLGMHHRFAVSSARRAAEQRVWTDLEEDAAGRLAELREFTLADLTGSPAGWQRFQRILEQVPPRRGGVTVVDSQWRVLFPPDGVAVADTKDSFAGTHIQWMPFPGAEAKRGRFLRGLALWPNDPQVAVVCALRGGKGSVLFHYPRTAVAALAASLFESLPLITVMTFVWTSALLGIVVYLVLARLYDEMDRQRTLTQADTLRHTQDLVRTRDAVIFGLAKLAESRDPETGDHLERISVYSTTLASTLHRDPRFKDEVTPAFVRLIGISSALHDIGKVGVADRILLKPGPLTPDERAAMQTHARIGGECLQDIERRLGGSNFLQMAREIAFAHHENWDGSGYPNGLASTAIPLSARIVAIADVYDALSSKRVYKGAFGHEECVEIIRGDSGKKFDPDIVEVWLTIESKFRRVAEQLRQGGHGAASVPSPDVEAIVDEIGEAVDRHLVSAETTTGQA